MEKQHTYVPAKISSLSLDADQKKKVQGKIIFFHRPVIQVIPNKCCHCLPKYNTKVEN